MIEVERCDAFEMKECGAYYIDVEDFVELQDTPLICAIDTTTKAHHAR